HQNEMRKITINTIIFLKDCYPQNKKINFVTFHNELMWGVNSNVPDVPIPGLLSLWASTKRGNKAYIKAP
ncbi:MAG TPA: hypothetical protein VN258_03315, partial [Mobilitalea sp.]|nr:hypothetical protein [Mobilitalea sp.]